MKKKLYKGCGILACLAVLLFQSCDSFLDDVKNYGPPVEIMTEADLQNRLNSFHAFTSVEGVTGRGMAWLENCSDNTVTGRAQAEADAIKNFQMTPDNGRDVKETYKEMYIVITKANSILKQLPKLPSNISERSKKIAEGQCYFYRAFAYLWLAPYYADNGPNGGLPIITENTPVEESDPARPATVLDNYDMMIADFRKAADLLPKFSELDAASYGRPHKAAAWAFAARAALYASQYGVNQPGYFNTVIEMCDNVMNMTGTDKRDLFDDGSANPFANLFRIENNFCSEYLFSLLGNPTEGPKYHGMSFQNGGWNAYNTWGYFQPTLELYKAFEPGDVRRQATILYPGEKIKFVGVERTWAVSPSAVSSTSGMTYRKFMSPWEASNCAGTTVNKDGDNASNKLGTVLIRFSDVLLMKAEALIWSKGEGNAEAKQLLNRIRKRARLPENSPATKDELKNQRRCELAFEFQPGRHVDLVRWGDAESVYSKPLNGVKTTLSGGTISTIEEIVIWPSRKFNPKVNHVFPLPASVIANSKNIIQNQY